MAADDCLSSSSSSPRRKRSRSPTRSRTPSSNNTESSRRHRRRHDLSVEVCKDFSRSICRRSEIACKFAHPPSNITIERGRVVACADSLRNKCFRGRICRYFHPPRHIQESLLKAIRMEDEKYSVRERSASSSSSDDSNDIEVSRRKMKSPSQSPRYDNNDSEASRRKRRRHDLSVEVCKDFISSGCRRAEIDCKFAHPPSVVTIEQGKVIACHDSLRGKCFRGRTCLYFHPPPQIQESLLKAIGMESTKDPMALQYLGSPVKLSSYHQPGNDDEFFAVCRDFLKNACNRRSCKFAHPDSYAMARLQHPGLSRKLHGTTRLENGAVPNATLYQDIIPVCKDFLKNSCNRDHCRYYHLIPQSEVYLQQHGALVMLPSSPPPSENEQERLSVCRDFLKNACQRDSCKYAHPSSQTKVIDNQVELCRDFRRGLCHRAICRFYHPDTPSTEK